MFFREKEVVCYPLTAFAGWEPVLRELASQVTIRNIGLFQALRHKRTASQVLAASRSNQLVLHMFQHGRYFRRWRRATCVWSSEEPRKSLSVGFFFSSFWSVVESASSPHFEVSLQYIVWFLFPCVSCYSFFVFTVVFCKENEKITCWRFYKNKCTWWV